MATDKKRGTAGTRRPGARSGVYGLTYWTGGYYLSPSQFGSYTTAQTGSTGGGEVTSTGGSSGGDSGGGGTT